MTPQDHDVKVKCLDLKCKKGDRIRWKHPKDAQIVFPKDHPHPFGNEPLLPLKVPTKHLQTVNEGLFAYKVVLEDGEIDPTIEVTDPKN